MKNYIGLVGLILAMLLVGCGNIPAAKAVERSFTLKSITVSLEKSGDSMADSYASTAMQQFLDRGAKPVSAKDADYIFSGKYGKGNLVTINGFYTVTVKNRQNDLVLCSQVESAYVNTESVKVIGISWAESLGSSIAASKKK